MADDLVFPEQPSLSVAIHNSLRRFPVHRIFCVGRNYHAHAAEMGDKIDKDSMEPFYFMKDRSAILPSGADLDYPPQTTDFHYEMELVVAIGQSGFKVNESVAQEMIYGYACGLDMTRRDLQQQGKDKRRPWDLGKNFEQSAVIAPIHRRSESGLIVEGMIELQVNGDTKQQSDLTQLIWSPTEIIAHLSKFYHLQPGDLIYTGTPEGVGPVSRGDQITGRIERLGELSVRVI